MRRFGAEVLKREVVLVALATLAAAIVFTWPQAADPGGSVVSYADVPYNAWVLGWVASRVAHGLIGLWNAPVFFPYPDTLRYVEPLIGIGVPLAPIYWLTGNAILLHNIAVWLSFGVAGTGGYLLGRDISGSRAGGVTAAAFAAFLPYRFAHLVHVQILMAGWLWWTAWAVHRYFARPSWMAAARCAILYILLGMSSLYWAYIGLVPIALLIAAECWRRRPHLMPLAAHAACATLMAGAVFVPVGIKLRHMTAADSPLMTAETQPAGADLIAYLTARGSLHVWGDVLRTERSGEADLFPGVTVVACALLSLVLSRPDRESKSWLPLYASLVVVGVMLSLGPTPSLNGHVLFRNALFDWLAPLPGFAQLRAIARFAVIGQLGLSVLAAYGVAAWLERRRASRREAVVTAGALAALVFVEGFGAPLDLRPFSPYVLDGDRSTYHWLARHPGGAAMELPLEGWGDRQRYGIYYQFRTLLHTHPIINGIGRFRPPLLSMLGDPESPVNDPARVGETAALLRGLGVRYVVLHRKWFANDALGEALRSAFAQSVGPPVAEFGESTIVDLGESAPVALEPAREVPRELLNLSVVRGNPSPMVDGNVATRWLSGRPQDGTEWIEVGLASPQPVTGVRLHLTGRSLNDYPRALEIDVAGDDGRFETVWSSSVLPQLGAGLRAAPAKPAIELRWGVRSTRMVRLRQIGHSARWYWSVHEIDVLSAP